MDQPLTLRKYTTLDEMKADEYRYWQSRPGHERMDAVEEMNRTAHALIRLGDGADRTKITKTFCPPCRGRIIRTPRTARLSMFSQWGLLQSLARWN